MSNNTTDDNSPQPMPEQPVVPQFPTDRIEKGEEPGTVTTKAIEGN